MRVAKVVVVLLAIVGLFTRPMLLVAAFVWFAASIEGQASNGFVHEPDMLRYAMPRRTALQVIRVPFDVQSHQWHVPHEHVSFSPQPGFEARWAIVIERR